MGVGVRAHTHKKAVRNAEFELSHRRKRECCWRFHTHGPWEGPHSGIHLHRVRGFFGEVEKRARTSVVRAAADPGGKFSCRSCEIGGAVSAGAGMGPKSARRRHIEKIGVKGNAAKAAALGELGPSAHVRRSRRP